MKLKLEFRCPGRAARVAAAASCSGPASNRCASILTDIQVTCVYCSGGLDILFGHHKEVQVEVPDSNGQVCTTVINHLAAVCSKFELPQWMLEF